MPDFTMHRYHNQYIEACTRCERIRAHVKDLEESVLYAEDAEEALAKLEEARAELKAAGEEVDRLYYLSTFGRSREEMAQKNTIRPVGLQPIAHQPSPPPPRKLR